VQKRLTPSDGDAPTPKVVAQFARDNEKLSFLPGNNRGRTRAECGRAEQTLEPVAARHEQA